MYFVELNNNLNLIIGDTYIVTWDGTEYECIAQADDNYHYLGDLDIWNNINNGGFPFCIGKGETGPIEVVTLDESETHTFKVEYKTFSKIDAKYLPDYVFEPVLQKSFTIEEK